MSSDLVLSDNMEVSPSEIFINGQAVVESEIDNACTAIVTNMYESGSEEEIKNAVTNLNGIEHLAGKAKARLIFEWSQFRKDKYPNENFAEWYTQTFSGEKLTVQKNLLIGELLINSNVPEEVKELPSKSLIHVARAVSGDYDLSDYWEEIELAATEQDIRDIIRKVKQKPQRKGSLSIYMDEDGTLTAWLDNEKFAVGWLNVIDSESNQLGKKAISRIVENSGIRRK